jgi:hypothetical protein
MENEGIMGLPEGQAMQDPTAPQQPTYVSSADSYDAALTALGMSSNDPAQAEAVRRAVRESIEDMDLSPTEVSSLLEVLEYMSQNPDEYPQLRQRLIDSGMMDDDDLPEAYDPAFLGMAIMVLNEYQAGRAQGAREPMEMGPVVEGMEPMAFAEGGLADVAEYLASKGRNGDSILAHITPAEARLLKAMGGSGTVNPETGIREFFLKKLFKSIKKAVKKLLKNPIVRIVATVALASVLGPAAAGLGMSSAAATAVGSTLASAGVSAMAGEKLSAKSLLINAATSYFGAGGTIGGFNPVERLAGVASKIPGVTEGGKLAQGIGAGLTSAAIGKAAGMSTQEALAQGLQTGVTTGIAYKPQVPASTAPETPPDVASGMGGDFTGARAPAIETAPTAGTAPTAATAGTTPTAATAGAAPAPAPAPAAPEVTTAPATTAAEVTPSTFFGRAGEFFQKPSFETFSNAFLVNPNAESGKLARYVPGVATGLALTGAMGGFKAGEVDESPLYDRDYTGMDFIRDNPELFQGGLQPTVLQPYNPEVPTPSYGLGQQAPPPSRPVPQPTSASVGMMPRSPAPTYMPPPGTATNMPGGIPQPYNVSGMYNVPLLYGNPVNPVYAAQGGMMDSSLRQAVNNPQQVAQAEGMLFGGPQAAQAASSAVQRLSANQGIMGLAEGGEVEEPNMRQEFMDEAARRIRAGGITGWIPNPINSLKAMANMRLPSVERAVEQKIESRRDFPKDAFGGPGIPFRQAGYGRMYMSGFDPTSGGTYDPGSELVPTDLPPGGFAQGGFVPPTGYAGGGQPTHFPRKNGPINGPGTGTSDSIPAMLSDGEFVFTAKAVRNAGGGSRRKGAKRMYSLMKKLEGGPVEA